MMVGPPPELRAVPVMAIPLVLVGVLVVGAVAAGLAAALGTTTGTAPGRLRAGPAVIGREVARLLRQRRRVPVAADVLLWRIGGVLPLLVAVLMIGLLPIGNWVVADSAVGLVWFNALDVVVWAAMWLTGWGANGVYPLIGGYRFLAQALAYELPLMFAVTAPAAAAGSLRIGDVVTAQSGWWFVVWMPVAFAVFCVGVAGFAVWGPLGSPVGVDIAGGVPGELSGVDRLVFVTGRYALLVAGSAAAAALFLGGGTGPLLPGWAWMAVKTLGVLGSLVVLRRRLPMLRPDRFLEVGWLILLPATLLQLLVVAVVSVWAG